MTTTSDLHHPDPTFVAALEAEVLRAWRAPASPQRSIRAARWRRRLAAGALLAVGLVLGFGTRHASAQAEASRERGERERAVQVGREAALLRVLLARQALEAAQVALRTGQGTRESVLAAELEARAAELEVARLDSELAEVRATSGAPRDELWAPLVNGRDFVDERLRLRAVIAEQRQSLAQAALAEAERRAAVGAGTVGQMAEAQRAVAESQAEFESLAQRLALRARAVRERLAVEAVAREQAVIDASTSLRRAQTLLGLAQQRLRLAQERFGVGAGTALDVKRAELEVLERQEEAARAQERIRSMRRP